MYRNELESYFKQAKIESPKVHCLTNSVVQNLTANALLSIGATPSMTIDPDEVGEFTASANALLVNLGTLDESRKKAIFTAIEMANEKNIPWVLDPVLINRAPKRLSFAKELLSLRPSLIRANSMEISALNIPINDLMLQTDGVVAITGAVDEVYALDDQGQQQYKTIEGGHELMAHVTGIGCAGTALMAAFLGQNSNFFESSCAALHMIGKAGEFVGGRVAGPASFETAFLDQLYSYFKRGSVDG